MAEYKIVMGKFTTQMNAVWGEPLYIEKKAFEKMGASIVEADGSNEETFIKAAEDADALLIHGGGVNVNRKVIESLKKCKISRVLFFIVIKINRGADSYLVDINSGKPAIGIKARNIKVQ